MEDKGKTLELFNKILDLRDELEELTEDFSDLIEQCNVALSDVSEEE